VPFAARPAFAFRWKKAAEEDMEKPGSNITGHALCWFLALTDAAVLDML